LTATAVGVAFLVALGVSFSQTPAEQKVPLVSLFALVGIIAGAWVNSTNNLFATHARENADRAMLSYLIDHALQDAPSLAPTTLSAMACVNDDHQTLLVKLFLKYFG